jgi:hypothetical protein
METELASEEEDSEEGNTEAPAELLSIDDEESPSVLGSRTASVVIFAANCRMVCLLGSQI